MKRVLFLAPLLLLAACGPSKEERSASFMKDCVGAFTKAQCQILFSLKEDIRDAKDSADIAVGVGAASIGANAGSK